MSKRICVNLTPNLNGGESLLFSMYKEKGMVYQKLTLTSYSSEANLLITSPIDPKILRNLADIIERENRTK